MPVLNCAELKLLICICRGTFGWGQRKFHKSFTELESATGLCNNSVLHGIKTLMASKIVLRTKSTRGDLLYALNMDFDPDEAIRFIATTRENARSCKADPARLAKKGAK